MKSEFCVNKDIVHNGVKGGLNENELSDLLKEVIPHRYNITRGIIENSKGEQSNETDILIYDNEILPSYMKSDLSFVPVEAVKYNFEVKSKLTSKELKSTVDKFSRYKSIGGLSPTVLFAFSTDVSGNELARYHKNEDEDIFFTNPNISALSVSSKCYYYKDVTEHYLKDQYSGSEWFKMVSSATGFGLEESLATFRSMMSDEAALSQMTRVEYARSIQGLIQLTDHVNNVGKNEITTNGIKFSEMKYKVHRWVGIEQISSEDDNRTELSLLSGISNTLSKGTFGNYLLNGKYDFKVMAICYEDMWGNLSLKDFNENGLTDNTNKVNFTFSSQDDKHKLTFSQIEPELDTQQPD